MEAFALWLHECLERAGVCTRDVRYEGRMRGSVDSVPTEVKLIIPADPKVPEFEEVVVHAFELSVSEAHRTAARRVVHEVHAQLRDRLAQTPYRFLPRACRGLRDFESLAHQYYEDAYAEFDEKFRVACRYIHAQDLALF